MKTKFFLITLGALFVSSFNLMAALILTPGVSEVDFNDAFNNDRVWYAQFQPGGSPTTHPDNQFELGGESLFYYEGNTTVFDKTDNPFIVDVSSSGFLSVTFNGIGTPGGFQYGVTEQFNTIWVGLKFNAPNGFANFLEINTHEVDGTAILPDMYLEEQSDEWTAFKFYKDDDLVDIGAITITGNINPDMFLGGAGDEDWTYTIFATHDSAIVPEPGSFILLLGALVAFSAFCRRSRRSRVSLG